MFKITICVYIAVEEMSSFHYPLYKPEQETRTRSDITMRYLTILSLVWYFLCHYYFVKYLAKIPTNSESRLLCRVVFLAFFQFAVLFGYKISTNQNIALIDTSKSLTIAMTCLIGSLEIKIISKPCFSSSVFWKRVMLHTA